MADLNDRARPEAHPPGVSLRDRIERTARRAWSTFYRAVTIFLRIDGAEWAGAFAFHAFLSLFPLMILLVALAALFIDRDRAVSVVIAYVEIHVPIGGPMQQGISGTIADVFAARRPAGVAAFLVLVWASLQSFTALISATNRAWGSAAWGWWRLPLKSLVLLGISVAVVFLSMGGPVLAKMLGNRLLPGDDAQSWVYGLGSVAIPALVVFLSLSLFYRLAPRRPTRFAEVWAAAFWATLLLVAAESLFVIYLKDFASLNAVYGAFGGIVALLLWIYLSGAIFVFGACLCAARAKLHVAANAGE